MPTAKKKGDEKGETFYRAHPISTTPTQIRFREYEYETERVPANIVAEGVLWWLLIVSEAILLVRLVFAAFGAIGGNFITSFIYTVSYPFVWFFFYLFNSLDRIRVTSPTFEIETLTAMLFYYIVVYIVVQLIQGFSTQNE